ncbi:hypothetical protein D5086_022569 [Populus alba]|uniref:Uncharacterized protein n=1 Tax=Populus alba TaxID=43335 RepID=A0ACC4BFZ9_POPAL
MKTILSSETMDIPDGVKIKINARIIEVEGPRGKLTRNFKHLNLDFQLIKDEEGKRKLKIDAWFGSRKTSAAIRTALSHVENLITGVTKGYRYKMRFVYAHFPINASIANSNTAIEIRNFLGEKKVRKVDMLEGVSIVRSEKVKDELVLDGNDIELVSRSAALINQKCHVKNKDIRKFLDGIYVSEKGTVVEEDKLVGILIVGGHYGFLLGRSKAEKQEIPKERGVFLPHKTEFITEEVAEIDPLFLFKGENEVFSRQWKQFITMQTWAPYAAMLLVQLAYGGSNILMKIALEKGLNQIVFVVYRHVIAVILKQRPSLSLSVIIKIFVLSSLGTTIHLNVYYAGLAYTSPTVASALSNVIPSLTFIMAVLLGMEKVKTESPRGWAKMLGTSICISGSLVFTFWKGGYLFKSFENRALINIYSTKGSAGEHRHAKENWIKGSALILTSHVAWSAWLILQAIVYKVYPARLSLNTLICFFASIQSSFLALFFARTTAIWKLDWNVQLLTIIYCGVVNSALGYYLQTWCISHKGPVFVAMFSPLLVVIVGLFSAFAFAERLHLGSLIGTGLIAVGLYCVLWGKRQDNSAAQKPDEGRGLADGEALEISINDYPLTNPDTSGRK